MEKVKESAFQFRDIRIMELKFDREDDIGDGEYKISISRNVGISNLVETNTEIVKKVTLEMRIESDVFNISAKISGDFKSKGIEKEETKFLFEQNAPSLLLSYLRPVISVITSQAQIDYEIPFLNFSDDELVNE